MNRRACVAVTFVLASWQLLGCGTEQVDEAQVTSEVRSGGGDQVGILSVSRNEFCVGESTHTIDTANNIVRWRFTTDNDSSYSKKQALVIGRVYHQTSGLYLECSANENVSFNACEIATPLGSEYNRSTGSHRCCIKKGWFGSFVCRETTTGDFL
ncbi:MAG TPA: hypothetical protein VK447_21215 [Myxococcaceae bacterium]|nr:hypothetical protein [Myxococcaceae bacterium]